MLGGSRPDAEDVLQDVFLRAYAALRDDDRPVTLRAWLYRVAHNRCVDHLRRPVPAAAEVYELSRTPVHDPPDETERREDLRRLVQDVQRLPEQQRSALLMREMDGLSYAELADALRTSIPAIKSLLVRARIGLVEAGEARDAPCTDIRFELTQAQRRGVRASGRSRRHLRDCKGCREYRRAMRAVDQGLAALAPGGSGPLATVAKLLGIGGASSGAAAGASMGGSAAVVGGATAATATKVAAIVCCAAVVGGGAAEVRDHVAPAKRKPHRAAVSAAPAPARAAAVAAPVVGVRAPVARRADPLLESPATGGRHAKHSASTLAGATTVAAPAAPEEIQTGGSIAPDEAPPPVAPPTMGTEGGSAGAPVDPSPPIATPAPAPAPAVATPVATAPTNPAPAAPDAADAAATTGGTGAPPG
jgi:RNA polymerase sigma factor (sigma-70 family)